jgi:carbon-monoxide dehydrogenase medium subunit
MISDFEHLAPGTLEEALTLLDKYGEEGKVIAGGQSLLILMRQGLVASQYLIDIKHLSELNYIKSDAKEGLKIGALTTHRAIEKSPVMQNGFGVLAEMERRLASIQTRNWGTIGGNLCHGDPAGDPAPVLIALNATLKMAGLKGERTIPAEDFFLDYFEVALEPGELLTEINIPPVPARTGTAYTKFNIIESDLATVGVAVSITLNSNDDTCKDARIALGASAPTPRRAKPAEEMLRGKKITESLLQEAGQIASAEAESISDIYASEEYRQELIKVMVKRVGTEAPSNRRFRNMKKELRLKVNGQPYEFYVKPKTLLVEVLRDHLGLTGTKRGCSSGSCGACTVILNSMAVKSCSMLALQADGAEVLTVEGLAKGTELHPLQKAFLDHGAFQCGFCTSGMLMSARALLDENPNPAKEEMKEGIDGNICRCTGYNSIIRAVTDVVKGKYKEAK